jgi:hypothetical protein
MADLEQQITDAASKPQQVTVDGTTAIQQPLSALIEADKYLAAKAAAKSKGRGFNIARLIPEGTVSGDPPAGGRF